MEKSEMCRFREWTKSLLAMAACLAACGAAAKDVTWAGATGANWDTTTANWVLTGTTIAEKVTRLRIDRAKQLLKASNVSLERVATACGFYNASHLGAVFRHRCGAPPSSFRRR